ncbi:transposase domain-containing protein, partial [Streptomyces sp. NPDC002742]|uniref:transposase domain-containing protein n=1 Tax=Streptomyces sp. NPDC002742 TaxID=3364663 RepID=UPI0036758306
MPPSSRRDCRQHPRRLLSDFHPGPVTPPGTELQARPVLPPSLIDRGHAVHVSRWYQLHVIVRGLPTIAFTGAARSAGGSSAVNECTWPFTNRVGFTPVTFNTSARGNAVAFAVGVGCLAVGPGVVRVAASVSDLSGLGLLTWVYPPGLVDRVVAACGRSEQRKRLLPARLVVYFVLGLALFSPAP